MRNGLCVYADGVPIADLAQMEQEGRMYVQYPEPAEVERNATLISAAPELLAALQGMVAFNSEKAKVQLSDMNEAMTLMGKARAAIAKATGRSE
jgi:hypothetical protein